MSNWTFVIIFSSMMLTIVFLSGCTASTSQSTGKLVCLGYCQFDVLQSKTEAEADGSTMEQHHGFAGPEDHINAEANDDD